MGRQKKRGVYMEPCPARFARQAREEGLDPNGEVSRAHVLRWMRQTGELIPNVMKMETLQRQLSMPLTRNFGLGERTQVQMSSFSSEYLRKLFPLTQFHFYHYYS